MDFLTIRASNVVGSDASIDGDISFTSNGKTDRLSRYFLRICMAGKEREYEYA